MCVCRWGMTDSLVPHELDYIACQMSLSMEFSKQEYYNGLSFPTPGALPTQWSNLHLLCLLHWQAVFTTEPPGKPNIFSKVTINNLGTLSHDNQLVMSDL